VRRETLPEAQAREANARERVEELRPGDGGPFGQSRVRLGALKDSARCRDHRATGTTPQALTRGPDNSSASAISCKLARKSSACVTIQSEPSAGRLGGKS
jgi:hypothetical protein